MVRGWGSGYLTARGEDLSPSFSSADEVSCRDRERESGKVLKCDNDGGKVRAHANNPVHWQQWSPETLSLAKKHKRVLFVSIGYAACHCNIPVAPNFYHHYRRNTTELVLIVFLDCL
jgi:hypothetical protein